MTLHGFNQVESDRSPHLNGVMKPKRMAIGQIKMKTIISGGSRQTLDGFKE